MKALLTAKVLLSHLDGDVAEQKLDLVQFPSRIAAQPCTGPTEVMRGQISNRRSFGAVLYHVPDHRLSYSGSNGLSCAGRRTETLDLLEGKIKPLIAQRLPLEEARRAREMLGGYGVLGKIVLLPNG